MRNQFDFPSLVFSIFDRPCFACYANSRHGCTVFAVQLCTLSRDLIAVYTEKKIHIGISSAKDCVYEFKRKILSFEICVSKIEKKKKKKNSMEISRAIIKFLKFDTSSRILYKIFNVTIRRTIILSHGIRNPGTISGNVNGRRYLVGHHHGSG